MRQGVRRFAYQSMAEQAAALGARLIDDVIVLGRTVLAWQVRARQRRHLAELSDYMLRDLGLTRADVFRETRKPFWRE
jgi:uncharacterized protein YjiS (DUF1127 family)